MVNESRNFRRRFPAMNERDRQIQIASDLERVALAGVHSDYSTTEARAAARADLDAARAALRTLRAAQRRALDLWAPVAG